MESLLFPRRHRISSSKSSSSSSAIHATLQRWGSVIAFSVMAVWLLSQLFMHTTLSSRDNNTRRHNNNDELERRLLVAIASQKHHHQQDDDDGPRLRQDEKAHRRKTHGGVSEQTRRAVENLRVPMPATPAKEVPYDIFDCPKDGPPSSDDYPFHWPMRKILTDWNPDDTDIPAQIHQSLCVFDWNDDYEAIVKYREAEVPFIVINQPDLMKASERWMTGHIQLGGGGGYNNNGEAQHDGGKESYLEKMIGEKTQPVEYSHSNQFIYWKTSPFTRKDPDWEPPTENIKLSYRDWYQRALQLQNETNATSHVSRDHWYFRLNAKGLDNAYLYDELPLFDPDQEEGDSNNVFMVEPERFRGINCRFGMRGVLAAMHYDSQRNWVILMGGQRRYILSHPRQCQNLHLYPKGHPSGRHSSVDWTNLRHDDPTILQDAQGTEVILQAAHALYLPSFYFHFIVSLNINYQCNARSGRSYEYGEYISDCGFDVPTYESEL